MFVQNIPMLKSTAKIFLATLILIYIYDIICSDFPQGNLVLYRHGTLVLYAFGGKNMKKLILTLLIFPLLFACATKVERMETDKVKDLSGKWNDTDSRLVAEEMIQDCLTRPWYSEATQKLGKKPTIIVGNVQNKTMEHINTDTFVEEIQRSIINSNKATFVASPDERGDVRTERLEQDEYASEETIKQFGKEIGADYMMMGILSSIIDKEGRKQVVFYQTNLKLVDIETNQIVWNGEKKIKKYVVKRKRVL
jgi:penicillin-binding protein activator